MWLQNVKFYEKFALGTVNPLLSPGGGGGLFSQALLWGAQKRGRAYLISQRFCILNASAGARFLEDRLVVTRRYTAFSNNKKMAAILHRELEHQVGGYGAEGQNQYEFSA